MYEHNDSVIKFTHCRILLKAFRLDIPFISVKGFARYISKLHMLPFCFSDHMTSSDTTRPAAVQQRGLLKLFRIVI